MAKARFTGGNRENGDFLTEALLPLFSPVQWVEDLGVGKKHRVIGIRKLPMVRQELRRFLHVLPANSAQLKKGVKVSIILSHPSPGSFNHAIATAASETLQARGVVVALHDLYAEQFDPIYTAAELPRDAALPAVIEQHCRELGEADGVVIIHPNYWSRPPAMLCGWVDRVIRPGRAYRFVPDGKGGARPEGLLKVKTAIVFTTANTPDEIDQSVYGNPLEIHWAKVVFGLCGVPCVRRSFSSVITSTPEQRAAWLDAVRCTVTEHLG